MPVKVYDGTNWVTVAGDGQQVTRLCVVEVLRELGIVAEQRRLRNAADLIGQIDLPEINTGGEVLGRFQHKAQREVGGFLRLERGIAAIQDLELRFAVGTLRRACNGGAIGAVDRVVEVTRCVGVRL